MGWFRHEHGGSSFRSNSIMGIFVLLESKTERGKRLSELFGDCSPPWLLIYRACQHEYEY
jgi:hypothetical protein